MAEPRYMCGTCGKWVCSACGGYRSNTNVRYCTYPCPRCRGLVGTLVPTMHTARMWRKDNDGPLPEPHPYGFRPSREDWPEGFGLRVVPGPRYRGVPLPEVPVDMTSWRMGVDAALGVRHG
jgi:hypothetical protein